MSEVPSGAGRTFFGAPIDRDAVDECTVESFGILLDSPEFRSREHNLGDELGTDAPSVFPWGHRLSTRDDGQLARWWASLSREIQDELSASWDPRREDSAWTHDEAHWRPLPIALQGFAEVDGSEATDRVLIKGQLLDYVLNHENVRFYLESRSFHICRQHRPAQALLRRGRIPHAFRCPKRGANCPFEQISKAAGGRAIRLGFRFAHTG